MANILVIGSGISGMTAAISCANRGMDVTLVSPDVSERAQSVMAAGGINASLNHMGEGDSAKKHAEDTLKGGCYLAGARAVQDLCDHAPEIVRWLESLGTGFSLNDDGLIDQRAFGGQSCRRTCYCGASTGKQIVTALIMEARRLEAAGSIKRKIRYHFRSGLIREGRCYGALLLDSRTGCLEPFFADAVIMATGGQNALFGKTTGSTLCDGYAAGRLLMQGAALKNLEFIQYHPTTLETDQKRMLISEAVRGEGGRLYYEEDGQRIYFMEDLFGEKGNLMPRDVVSRSMYQTHRDVWLDISFRDDDFIDRRLPEVRDLCMKYRGIDIHRESIPVAPSVHFFMGGLAADENHETSISNLYAVGECASRYHGANRLGGNSLLAAVHSARVAAEAIYRRMGSEETRREQVDGSRQEGSGSFSDAETGRPRAAETDRLRDAEASRARDAVPDFDEYIAKENAHLDTLKTSKSHFPVMYIRDMVAETMGEELGIVRDEDSLTRGIESIDFYIDQASRINYDPSASLYDNYSLEAILLLAKATLICARERKESRGAHYRSDYPQTREEFGAATIITLKDGEFQIGLDTGGEYES